jgi:integrase
VRDYVYLSLFTGARQANVLAMRWDQIDFGLGIWTIPRTKSGDSHTIPLTSSALEILSMRRQSAKGEWVFSGDGKTGHLVEPKKGWRALLKEAGIKDLRMHDLRRTLGSYMAMGNQSLHMIGKALGHKSPTATQIYSRLAYDPLRQAMEKAQSDMFSAAGLMPKPSESAKKKYKK